MFGSGRRRDACSGRTRLLDECATGECVRVVGNRETRAMEMGFYPGAQVCVLSNDPSAASMVVSTGDTRLVLPREIAATIMVRHGLHHGRRWRRRLGRRSEEDDHAETDS